MVSCMQDLFVTSSLTWFCVIFVVKRKKYYIRCLRLTFPKKIETQNVKSRGSILLILTRRALCNALVYIKALKILIRLFHKSMFVGIRVVYLIKCSLPYSIKELSFDWYFILIPTNKIRF